MVLNGTVGARLHVPFPVLNRSSFGFWLSYFSVISRVVLAMFWFGIQTFVGSECVYQVCSISPASLLISLLTAHLVVLDVESYLAIYCSSTKPPSSQCKHHYLRYVSTRPCYVQSPDSTYATCFIGMICYFLYWLIQFPFMLVSPQKIRWLFLAKAIIVPPTWLALLIWAFVKVPPNSGILAQKAELSGSALSWAWLSALNSALGLYATLGVNIPDFTVSHTRSYYDRRSCGTIGNRDMQRTNERT